MITQHIVTFACDVFVHLIMAALCLGGVYALLGIIRIALGKRDN